MRAMILAAGRGERLVPLTDALPKPAVPICNRPAIWYALDCLYQHGIRQLAINTFHLGEALQKSLNPLIPADMQVDYVLEDELLGTAGGVCNALQTLKFKEDSKAPFVVFNGKLVFFPNLYEAIKEHCERHAFATMVLRAQPFRSRYGVIERANDGSILRMLGYPEHHLLKTRSYMFTGVHVLSVEACNALPDRGCIVRDGYLKWLEQGHLIHGYVSDAPWHEVSTAEAYFDANMALLSEQTTWPGFSAPHESIHPTAKLGAGAGITQSVIGASAEIAAHAKLDRCIVWPNAHVLNSISHAIVTPHTSLRLPNGPLPQ